jgi:hypothetical protein
MTMNSGKGRCHSPWHFSVTSYGDGGDRLSVYSDPHGRYSDCELTHTVGAASLVGVSRLLSVTTVASFINRYTGLRGADGSNVTPCTVRVDMLPKIRSHPARTTLLGRNHILRTRGVSEVCLCHRVIKT